MTDPRRARYVVGAKKIPYQDRDVAHAVMTRSDPRNFQDVINANDDDEVPLGADVTYAVELTEEEAERFRRASNARYVEPDEKMTMDVVTVRRDHTQIAANVTIPPPNTMAYMGATFAGASEWHGKDVTIAVMDGGTTEAVKDRFGWQLVAHKNFVDTSDTNPNTITVEHGCYVTPEAVPAGGRLIEAVVFDESGTSYHSVTAAAMKWAADQGAQVINYSGSGSGSSGAQRDGLRYLQERGVVLVASAGNDGAHRLGYPSAHCVDFPNVKSSIAFVESTDDRADFSNHHETGSGCAPGARCLSVNKDAVNIRWSGTSSSSPKMALLIAMGCTGGKYTPLEVARALEVNARDTREPTTEEGAGAWDLVSALRKLGAFDVPPPPPPKDPPADPPTDPPVDPTPPPVDPNPQPKPPEGKRPMPEFPELPPDMPPWVKALVERIYELLFAPGSGKRPPGRS